MEEPQVIESMPGQGRERGLLREDEEPTSKNLRSVQQAKGGFTARAVFVGILIGTTVSVSNVYFGLQVGWSSAMSIQSTLLGFVAFKAISRHLRSPFTVQENVLVQTVAGAVGCMPVTAGLTGVIPALQFLLPPAEGGPVQLHWSQALMWSMGVGFFGLLWAMVFRTQFIVKERLPWPGAVATATLISVLHTGDQKPGAETPPTDSIGVQGCRPATPTHNPDKRTIIRNSEKIRALLSAAIVSGCLVSQFAPEIWQEG